METTAASTKKSRRHVDILQRTPARTCRPRVPDAGQPEPLPPRLLSMMMASRAEAEC
jgi:hypothetical protein